jgi:hypothetical protein
METRQMSRSHSRIVDMAEDYGRLWRLSTSRPRDDHRRVGAGWLRRGAVSQAVAAPFGMRQQAGVRAADSRWEKSAHRSGLISSRSEHFKNERRIDIWRRAFHSPIKTKRPAR